MINDDAYTERRDKVLKIFLIPDDKSIDVFRVRAICERYCSIETKCNACVKICDERCYWNAIAKYVGNKGHPGSAIVPMSLKPGILRVHQPISPIN